MTNIRKMSKTTFGLLLYIIGIVIVTILLRNSNAMFLVKAFDVLDSKIVLSGFHNIVISISFWLLVFTGIVDVIQREYEGIYVIKSFQIPFLFSLIFSILALVFGNANWKNEWFWILYYGAEIITIRLSFNKLSMNNIANPKRARELLKSITNEKTINGNKTDYYLVFFMRVVLLIIWILLIISLIFFLIQNKTVFGF